MIGVVSDDERRRELGDFLRKRRGQLVRAGFDLAPIGRNRHLGLRREEIAYHAGLSVTWYTWLEQGRDINPSRQVLDSIAHQMRLTLEEHHYLLTLAGYAPAPPVGLEPAASAPPHLQRLLDAQDPAPAFAIASDWSIAAWNRGYAALYPRVVDVAPADRNLLLFIFTDPAVRDLLPDWEETSARFLAEYRTEAGASLGRPAHAALIARLLGDSPEFARAWHEHRIRRFASRERRFHHPSAGELVFEHHRLTPSDLPELHVVIYLPANEHTRVQLERLIAPGQPTT